MPHTLLVFGPGYSALPIMKRAKDEGWRVIASYRDEDKSKLIQRQGFETVEFSFGKLSLPKEDTLHILCSIATKSHEDPSLSIWKSWLIQQKIDSLHYLSSTNVYGNHDGAWVDENSETKPSLVRGEKRLLAEQEWQKLGESLGSRTFIYRLAGIYGPNRNAFCSLKSGKARCLIKEGQVFGRIHQEDISQTVWSALSGEHAGGVFNLADDLPTAPHIVIEEAAKLLGIDAPPHENWETAELSEMARSFYLESKRVKNDKIKSELGITLKYPTYKEGLKALLKDIDY